MLMFFAILSSYISFPYLKKLVGNNHLFVADLFLIVQFIIQAVIGLWQFIVGRSIGADFLGESVLLKHAYTSSWIDLEGKAYLRAYGTFAHPNIFGIFLLLLLMYFLFSQTSDITRRIHSNSPIRLLISFLISIIIVITLSRTAIVLAFLAWVIFAFSMIKYTANSFNSLIISPPGFIVERFLQLFSEGRVSLTDRVELLKISAKMIKENPFTGVGFGRFVVAMGPDTPWSFGRSLFEPVHNIYMLILSEHGVIAGSFLIIYLLILIINSFRSVAMSGKKNYILSGLLLILTISLFFVGFIDHFLITLPQGVGLLSIFIFSIIMIGASFREDLEVDYADDTDTY